MALKKWWHYLIILILVGGLAIAALITLAVALIYPALPSLEALTDYRPKQPLRVYSSDGYLISEFGEERRKFIKVDKIPKTVKDAVLAIEDRRFYEHGGVDYHGMARAIVNNMTGAGHEGASTITMQVAKNFFSHGERNLKTKIYEACLAVKIEHTLEKDQILELYLNQIYLGQRAFGFSAAAQVYYGKNLDQLTLAESAMLAGLPKAPSANNPFTNLTRATAREHQVLNDMHRYNMINDAQYEAALAEKLVLKPSHQSRDLAADYVAEIVRQTMYDRYQDDIYSSGLNVYTTIQKANQEAANEAILQGILDYDGRHGYRGSEKNLDSALLQDSNEAKKSLEDALDGIETIGVFIPAVITRWDTKSVKLFTKTGISIEVAGDGLSLVQKTLNEKDATKRSLKVGSVVRVLQKNGAWRIVQIPEVESALVALNPETGAVTALVGGFDFHHNKFNHVTQAWRQPGSSFKPFVYSAALEKGFTAASIVEDAPFSLSAKEVGSDENWDPHNYESTYDGPIRLRTALTKSKNMVSIRVLQAIGPAYAQDYITRFGFSAKDHPAYLAMALGAGSTTPWLLAGGYATFANGGYRVKPYLIEKIVDSKGKLIEQAKAPHAGVDAPRAIDARNAFIMTSMLQDVIRAGTATRAKSLGRADIAGKTGTTNNQMDAWFGGFNAKQVAVAWIGFDNPRTLGKDETGGKAALPIWIRYMATALKGLPDVGYAVPQGIISIKINPTTGAQAGEDASGIYEYFYDESPPPEVFTPLPPMINEEDLDTVDKAALPTNILNPSPDHINTQNTPNTNGTPNPTPDDNAASKVLNPSGF